MIFLFLVPRPSMVRCLEPEQHANIEDTMGNEKWKLNDQSLRDAAMESLRMASEDDPLMVKTDEFDICHAINLKS